MKPVRYLLDAEGRAALARLMTRRPLLGFDFDGTLAPIVMHPDEARIPARTAALLARLAERVPIAVVSGRQVLDVRHRRRGRCRGHRHFRRHRRAAARGLRVLLAPLVEPRAVNFGHATAPARPLIHRPR